MGMPGLVDRRHPPGHLDWDVALFPASDATARPAPYRYRLDGFTDAFADAHHHADTDAAAYPAPLAD